MSQIFFNRNFCLAVVLGGALLASAQATTTTIVPSRDALHDWALEGVLQPIGLSTYEATGISRFLAAANSSTSNDVTSSSSPSVYVSSQPLTYVLRQAPAAQRNLVASAVVAVQTLCVATNNATLSRSLSLLDIARHLTATKTIADVRLAIVMNNSASSDALLTGLSRVSGSGFTSATFFPPTVSASNPNVVVFNSDDEVATWLLDGINDASASIARVGFLPLFEASRRRLKCFSIDVVHPKTRLVTAVTPRLDGAWGSLVTVSGLTVTMTSLTDAVYPLLVPIIFNVRTDLACSGSLNANGSYPWEEFAYRLFYEAAFLSRLQQWGALRPSEFPIGISYGSLSSRLCSGRVVIPSLGSSAAQNVHAALSAQYLLAGHKAVVAYSGGGSGVGITALKARTHLFVGSDTILSDQEHRDYPTLQFVPAAAFAVVITYNIPDRVALVIPRCALVPIFNGSLRYWDDARLQNANPGIALPHYLINVIVRGERSGTVETFTTGLALLDAECNPGQPASVGFARTDLWSVNFTNQLKGTGTNGVVSLLTANAWSVAFVSQDAARLNALPEAAILDDKTGAQVAATPAAMADVLSRAILNDRLEVTFNTSGGAYPFAGMTYYALDMAQRAPNCSAAKSAMDFLLWTFTTAEAQSAQLAKYFFPLPDAMVDAATAVIASTSCEGSPLYPVARAGLDLVSIVLIGVLGPIALILAAFLLYKSCAERGTRDVSCAPKDPLKEVSIVFTDIQSSTAMWAQVPQHMGPALDRHHEIIRQIISSHKAYEVKTIGDSFMIACKSAEQAVDLALEIQDALMAEKWGTGDFDAAYGDFIRTMYTEALGHEDNIADPTLWNGLRVRVGIATGLCDIKFDEVTKGYDYYGTTVNTAARVESVAHGGQIVVAEGTWKCLDDSITSGLKTINFGPQMLRGLEEAVVLHQISRPVFANRWFPPLRLDKDFDAEFDEEIIGSSDNKNTTSSSHSSRGNSNGDARTKYVKPQDRVVMHVGRVLSVALSTLSQEGRDKLLGALCRAWRVRQGDDRDSASTHGGTTTRTARESALLRKLKPISRKIAHIISEQDKRNGGTTFTGANAGLASFMSSSRVAPSTEANSLHGADPGAFLCPPGMVMDYSAEESQSLPGDISGNGNGGVVGVQLASAMTDPELTTSGLWSNPESPHHRVSVE